MSADAIEIASTRRTGCVVVGAGPAGAVLSLLLARAGIRVALLESHSDFDRDFRGDTVHPSTLEILDQLGLAEKLHQLPHGTIRQVRMVAPSGSVTVADFGWLRTRFPYILMIPQAKLLDLLVTEASRFPNFELTLNATVQRLVEEDGSVRGVRYRAADGRWHEVRADLSVAADGRFSKLRHLAGIEPVKTAPPMDVVWFRLPRRSSDPADAAELHIGGGHFAVILDRADDWQIAYVILKGSFAAVRAAGMGELQKGLAEVVPWLADRVGCLTDWSQVSVLNVESSCVPIWHKPGLLLIGDAAHAMSPVGGVGINYAVQDAVEAANLLAEPLRRGTVTDADLANVQKRRERPVRFIQRVQAMIQDRIAAPGLTAGDKFRLPLPLRIISKVPGLRALPARVMGYGLRKVRVREGLTVLRPPS
ncbi:MAG: FAD-dependent oxidoreductase [Gemmataceae bacterium]